MGFLSKGSRHLRYVFRIARMNDSILIMILIEVVFFPTRKYMKMKVPNLLISRGLVMLSKQCTVATISGFHGESDFFARRIYFCESRVIDIVNMFNVFFRDDNDITWIVYPPFWRDVCEYGFVLIHNIA